MGEEGGGGVLKGGISTTVLQLESVRGLVVGPIRCCDSSRLLRSRQAATAVAKVTTVSRQLILIQRLWSIQYEWIRSETVVGQYVRYFVQCGSVGGQELSINDAAKAVDTIDHGCLAPAAQCMQRAAFKGRWLFRGRLLRSRLGFAVGC
jgi:hypothetical protein